MQTVPPNTQESADAISVREVRFRYDHAVVDALRGVSLDVPHGEIFGLLGPNGAGKSTLLGLLAGSLTLQDGNITIAGRVLPRHAREAKRVSAMVPQEYAFYESLSGRQNLDYFGQVFGLSRRQLDERRAKAAAICRLEADLQRRAGEYSGGLKRRLNLAIGLLNEPAILYLDEPTVGIDAESRRCILDAVEALKSRGTTIVYTSHYMEEVEALCDSVAIIDRGQVVVHERMAELLRREGGQSLHIELQGDDAQAAQLLQPFGATRAGEGTWQVTVPREQLTHVLSALERANVGVTRMQYGVSRLEEIYLGLLLRDGVEAP